MQGLPEPADFPDQPELAAEVCRSVAAELQGKGEDLSYVAALRVFVTRADQYGLALPMSLSCLTAWMDTVDEILRWYEEALSGKMSSKTLLFHVRHVVRSERFTYAPNFHIAQLCFVWATLEARSGHLYLATEALDWALARLADCRFNPGVSHLYNHMVVRAAQYRQAVQLRASLEQDTPLQGRETHVEREAGMSGAGDASEVVASGSATAPREEVTNDDDVVHSSAESSQYGEASGPGRSSITFSSLVSLKQLGIALIDYHLPTVPTTPVKHPGAHFPATPVSIAREGRAVVPQRRPRQPTQQDEPTSETPSRKRRKESIGEGQSGRNSDQG